MSDSNLNLTSQPMTSSTQQEGSINLAFDHGEQQISTSRLNTPTEIFCVTNSSTSLASSPSIQNHGDTAAADGEDSSKQIKSVKGPFTIDIRSTTIATTTNTTTSPPSSGVYGGLEVSNRVASQSVCTLSEIDIPIPLTTPRLQPDNLNAWLQEQESTGTDRFDTPVTSYSQDIVVCMQAAGPSHTSEQSGDVDNSARKQQEEECTAVVKKPAAAKRTDSSLSVCSSVWSEGRSCRICWMGEGKEVLIQPCKCSGSVANVHVSCLKKWLQVTNQFKCEVCRQEYVTAKALKPICKWSWRCSKTRPLSQLEAILILLGIVTPPLLCGIVLCSQKVSEYLPDPQHAWKTATLLTLVIASALMYVAALIYFCFKLSAVCSQWVETNQRTVVRLGSVDTVIENNASVLEAREEESEHQQPDHDLFAIWSIG